MKYYLYFCTKFSTSQNANIIILIGMEKRRIKITTEGRRLLLEELGVTAPTLYRYLTYQSDTYAARTARKRALEMGGRIVEQRDITEQTDNTTEPSAKNGKI